MTRFVLFLLGAVALAGCAKPQPAGENLWKLVELRR